MISDKKILITGVAGFIGSNLADEIIKCHNIVGIDNFDSFYSKDIKKQNIKNLLNNKNFKFYELDILDTEAMQKVFNLHTFDIVIHLAAKAGVRPSISDPQTYYNNNLFGTLSVLNFIKKFGIKHFIFASSSSVYGNDTPVPFTEAKIVDAPISPYAASKRAAELLCYTFHSLFAINIVCLRFFTVYGRRQRPDLAIAKFTKSIIENKPITVYGDGSFRRDYTYINDIVDGIIKTVDWLLKNKNSSVYEAFNLGESKNYSVIELICEIEKSLQKNAKLTFLPEQPGDVKLTCANIEKAKSILGYNPCTDLSFGIQEYIKYM